MRVHLVRLIKMTTVYGMGSVGVQIVGFLLLPILTRYLTPGDYGILETLITISSIISIFLIFGMDNSLFLFYFDSDNPEYKKKVIATTSVFITFLSVITVIGLMLGSRWLNQVLFATPKTLLSLQLVILLGAVMAVYKIPTSIFRLKRQPGLFSMVNILNVILSSGLSILFLVVFGLGFQGRIEGLVISMVFVLLVSIYLIRNNICLKASWELLIKMLKTAIPVIPAGLAIWVLALSDRILLLKLTNPSEVGLYAIGMRFTAMVSLVVAAFNLAWSEFALSLPTQEDRNRIYARILTYFTLVTGVIVLGLSLFAKQAILLMTTKDYLRASDVIPFLGLAFIFNGYYSILAVGLNLTKKMGVLFPVTAIPAVLSVFANLALIPHLGMIGAALTNLGCYLLMALLMFIASQRVYPIRYEWGRILKIFMVLIGIIVMVQFISVTSFWAGIAVHTGLLLLFGLLLLGIGFFSKEELGILRRMLRIRRRMA